MLEVSVIQFPHVVMDVLALLIMDVVRVTISLNARPRDWAFTVTNRAIGREVHEGRVVQLKPHLERWGVEDC